MGYLLTNATNALRQYFGGVCAAYHVTYPQYRALTYLFSMDNQKIVNQRDLEHALGIKASSVSSLVRNLEQKGLIQSKRLPRDTRNKQITLTDQGRSLHASLETARLEAERMLTRGFSGEELELLRQMLRKLMENLETKE